jgi:hypothetical protein
MVAIIMALRQVGQGSRPPAPQHAALLRQLAARCDCLRLVPCQACVGVRVLLAGAGRGTRCLSCAD